VSTPALDHAIELLDQAAEGREVDPFGVELRDGSWALLRPIRPTDKARLRRGLDWLSPRSRELAFHLPVNDLTDEQLRYVTEIDHAHHVAWVALDPDDLDAPGMGIGRYVRLRRDPQVAEAAITVVDRYQGRGLGTLLLALLVRSARHHGIEVFRNYVLADNATMLGMFEELGATSERIDRRVLQVDFELPDDIDTLPDTPAGRAMRAFASRHDGPQLAFTLPPVWVQRLEAHGEDVATAAKRAAEEPTATPWRERGPFAHWLDAVLDEPDGHGAAHG
jgi:GNAT superfamily N-acetyltransferase